jgi:hypothetical protein
MPPMLDAGEPRHPEIAQRCEPFLPPGAVIRHVFGASPYPRFLPAIIGLPLTLLHGDRIVAVTDDAVFVLRATHWWGWTPKRLLRTLPRDTRFGPVNGMVVTRIPLGGELLRVGWRFFPDVEAADHDLRG